MGMMINDLRKLLKGELDLLETPVYYRVAPDTALYPHIIFTLSGMSQLADDINRYNYDLVVDIYDRSTSDTASENLAESIIKLLSKYNTVTEHNYPTIYFESYMMLEDEDKNINHKRLSFELQSYER